MAAKREIATRFRLEGESEYRKAMTDAANALKVLDSEQKLAKAQFEQTGDAQAYAAEQTRILQEKILQQKNAVDAAQRAMKELTDNGVKPSDKTYQTWAKKLNDANTSLTKMQTELSGVEGGMKSTDTAAEDLGETLTVIDPETRFQNTLKAVEDMRDRLNAVVKTAVRAGKAVWDMESDAGAWADNLATAASQAGLDVETYQSWQYASRFIDASVDDISKSIRKTENDLKSTSEEVIKTYNQLGVVTRNTDDSVRDATAVFWDTVDALGRVEDATKRGIYAQTLLGSHYNSLNPLIEAGSQAYKDMAEEGMRTAVVQEEQVNALAALNDAQEKLDATLQKAKFDTLAALAPTFATISEGLQKAVQSFNEFTQSAEGQEALKELNDALSGVVNSFLGEDNGKGTFQKIVEGATGAIHSFTDALKWISENGGTVKAIMIGMGVAWAGLNIAPPVMQFMHLLKNIPLQKLTAIFGGGGAASGAASAAGNAASGAATGGGAMASGGFSNFARGMGEKLLGLVSAAETTALAWAAGESIFNAAKEIKAQGTLLGTGPGNTDAQGNWQLGQSGIYLINPIDAFRKDLASANDAPLRDPMGIPLAELEALNKQAEEAAAKAAESFTTTIQEKAPEAAQAAGDMAQAAVKETEQEMSFLETVGNDAATNLARGISNETPKAVSAAQSMAEQVLAVINQTLSRVAAMTSAFPSFGGYVPGLPAGGAPTGSGAVNVTLQMDKKVVGTATAPIINSYLAAEMDMR